MSPPDRPLRRGWTTGTCATAAAKAAYMALLTGEFPDPVEVTLPRCERPSFALAMTRRERDCATAGVVKDAGDDPGRPRQRAHDVEDNGMGDVLRFDAERLRILVERHHLHTGSARARELLEDWDRALACFVKVMPKDYKRALLQARERATAKAVAAE